MRVPGQEERPATACRVGYRVQPETPIGRLVASVPALMAFDETFELQRAVAYFAILFVSMVTVEQVDFPALADRFTGRHCAQALFHHIEARSEDTKFEARHNFSHHPDPFSQRQTCSI